MSYKSPWYHPTSIFIFLLSTTATSSLAPPPQTPPTTALKPNMTIIVGLLTTIFSITFLLLLYAKHCRRSHTPYPLAVRAAERINSGIDRTIIESLPVFRFGSLSGQKDGLECAVCLSRFDPNEMLRLLPKCKHAFHVECVDTWLDAHSTCPLCRYRVDPEDIFLIIGEHETSRDIDYSPRCIDEKPEHKREIAPKRVSGRHSSAGEKVTGIKISVESPSPAILPVTGSRRSLDEWNVKKNVTKKTTAEERRKDGMLLVAAEEERRRRRRSFEKRFEHRIVVGTGGTNNNMNRWSDVQPSDLLYLRSEMMVMKRSRPVLHEEGNNGLWENGRSVINSKSMSEMSGLSRFGSNEAGVLSRWLARLSEPKSGRNSSSSNV